jgi:hypothetical protein
VREAVNLPVPGNEVVPERVTTEDPSSRSSQAPLLAVSHQPFTSESPPSALDQGGSSAETGAQVLNIADADLTKPGDPDSLRGGSELAERRQDDGPLHSEESQGIREPTGEATSPAHPDDCIHNPGCTLIAHFPLRLSFSLVMSLKYFDCKFLDVFPAPVCLPLTCSSCVYPFVMSCLGEHML